MSEAYWTRVRSGKKKGEKILIRDMHDNHLANAIKLVRRQIEANAEGLRKGFVLLAEQEIDLRAVVRPDHALYQIRDRVSEMTAEEFREFLMGLPPHSDLMAEARHRATKGSVKTNAEKTQFAADLITAVWIEEHSAS